MYKTIIVIDKDYPSALDNLSQVINFETYLREYPKLNEPRTRLVNLCDTNKYLSEGYYCSLLAEARNHHVLPSVKTINEMREGITELVDSRLANKQELQLIPSIVKEPLFIFLGTSENPALKSLGKKVFSRYPVPVLKIRFSDDAKLLHIELCTVSQLTEYQQQSFINSVNNLGSSRWQKSNPGKSSRWDMAILVNPEETEPPSDKAAISCFIKAAAKLGIQANAVTAAELIDINQYDALFIRETTAIDHYTYRLAVKAEQNGLVVMDDPVSILRCCNKVFLHDAFNYQKVPSPRTEVIRDCTDATIEMLEQKFSYPIVLKMPESSFSKGVYKVTDRNELLQRLNTLLSESALALVQEYLYTEFDWRVGVLNGQAIYACRYLMARNHWQIYNHANKQAYSGGFESVATFEVPRPVLDAALRAAKIIGNGLYGVDVKEVEGKAYVLEVNDNPSMEKGVEDSYVGNELYMQIMGEFLRRLEARGK